MLFAIALYRRGRICDAVVAHAITNVMLGHRVDPAGSLRAVRRSRARVKVNERTLKHRPTRYGFAAGRWTAANVRDLIERRTGVRYHPAHVSRILRELKERKNQSRYQESYRELKAMMAAAKLARRTRHVRRSEPLSGGPMGRPHR